MRGFPWVVALTLAVGLHASVIAYLARTDMDPDGAEAPGESGVVIDLAPAGQTLGDPEALIEPEPE
ncbi:hypothetical protein LPW28_02405, partial [Ectothiorhodospira sp. 9905]|nr:hypothetical protein [Ectothiorhodospira sp. 9905]